MEAREGMPRTRYAVLAGDVTCTFFQRSHVGGQAAGRLFAGVACQGPFRQVVQRVGLWAARRAIRQRVGF